MTEEEKDKVEKDVGEALDENFKALEEKQEVRDQRKKSTGDETEDTEGDDDEEMDDSEERQRISQLKRRLRINPRQLPVKRLSHPRRMLILKVLVMELRKERTRKHRRLRTKRTPATCSLPGRCLSS